mmetsp:Transcript_24112/g.67046  ORF Transcript_24112/g.67046 Transcript_24112/m.67046 type:complete len:359 (-) Transcript_24112:2534-3610(-)
MLVLLHLLCLWELQLHRWRASLRRRRLTVVLGARLTLLSVAKPTAGCAAHGAGLCGSGGGLVSLSPGLRSCSLGGLLSLDLGLLSFLAGRLGPLDHRNARDGNALLIDGLSPRSCRERPQPVGLLKVGVDDFPRVHGAILVGDCYGAAQAAGAWNGAVDRAPRDGLAPQPATAVLGVCGLEEALLAHCLESGAVVLLGRLLGGLWVVGFVVLLLQQVLQLLKPFGVRLAVCLCGPLGRRDLPDGGRLLLKDLLRSLHVLLHRLGGAHSRAPRKLGEPCPNCAAILGGGAGKIPDEADELPAAAAGDLLLGDTEVHENLLRLAHLQPAQVRARPCDVASVPSGQLLLGRVGLLSHLLEE